MVPVGNVATWGLNSVRPGRWWLLKGGDVVGSAKTAHASHLILPRKERPAQKVQDEQPEVSFDLVDTLT